MWLFNVSENEYNGIQPLGSVVLMDEVVSFSETGQEIYSETVQTYLANGFEIANYSNGYREIKTVAEDGTENVQVYKEIITPQPEVSE